MTWRRTPGRLVVIAWLVLAAGQTGRLVATGSLMSGDGVYHFAHLHSIVVDGDLDPVNEIRHFREQARSRYTGRPKIGDRVSRNPATGEVVNKYPIGLALLTLPAYVTVFALSHALAAVGVPADISGYGRTYQYGVGLLVAAYAVLGLWCCQRVAASCDVTDADAWWATLLVAGATPWLFYSTLEPLFSHALTATVAAVFVWQWLDARRGTDLGPWFLTGAAAGVGALVRYQDAVLLLGPLLDRLAGAARGNRRALMCALALAGGAATAIAPQLAINYHLFGHPLTTGYFGEGFFWRSPRLALALLSPEVGLLRWSPIVALALAGLAIGSRWGWPHARWGAVLVAVQVYVVSSWYFVTQGHAFGNRMLVSCTVFFAVGLAAVLTSVANRRRLRLAILAFGIFLVGVNLLLMGLWCGGVIGPLADGVN